MLLIFSEECQAPFTIPNSAISIPQEDSFAGRTFVVICAEGYVGSTTTGEMECDSNKTWTNKPTCDHSKRAYEYTYIMSRATSLRPPISVA